MFMIPRIPGDDHSMSWRFSRLVKHKMLASRSIVAQCDDSYEVLCQLFLNAQNRSIFCRRTPFRNAVFIVFFCLSQCDLGDDALYARGSVDGWLLLAPTILGGVTRPFHD